MRAPDFWYPEGGRANLTATVLTPVGWLYGAASQWKMLTSAPRRTVAQVICVGNLTAGGTGKTPVCLALNDLLSADGTRTAFLTRGYGGKVSDPTRVDPTVHGFEEAGDEALLLARGASTWISPTRRRGAEAASRDGAEVILMDDGFQNPAINKDLSLLVIDGESGFGNRRMIPAGPCANRYASVFAVPMRSFCLAILPTSETGIWQRQAACHFIGQASGWTREL